MKFLIRNSILVLIFGILLSPAQADISGVWNMREGSMNMRVDYRDNQHIRMEMAPGTYLLVQGDKTYAVTNGAVLDLAAMGQQFQAMGFGDMVQQRIKNQEQLPIAKPEEVLTKTNKTETIAGIKGQVYKVSFIDPQSGKKVEEEVVLTEHENLVKLQHAMAIVAQANIKSMGMPQAPIIDHSMQPYLNQGLAVLRYGKEMTLVSLNENNLDDAIFNLPEGKTPLDPFSGMNQMMQQMMNKRQ